MVINKNDRANAFQMINDRIAEAVTSYFIIIFLQEVLRKADNYEFECKFGFLQEEISKV